MSVYVAPTLCDRCSAMFQGSFSSMQGNWNNHHDSMQSLEQAADKNCIICRDVWKDMMKRSNFDRQTLYVAAASKNQVTNYWIKEGYISVDYLVHTRQAQSYRCLETQRKSALQPRRVQTLCTDVKQ